MGSPRATHSMLTPFLHASLMGLKGVQSSLQRESWVSTEQPHGLSPSQSMRPNYQATNSRVILKGAWFPRHGRSHHSPNTGQAQGDSARPFPPRDQDIALSPTDTGSGLGSVRKALITPTQHGLVTHLLPILG